MTSDVMWPLLCVAAGLLLVMAEAFIPSGGLIGLLALGLLGWGVVLAFQRSTNLGLGFLFGVAVVTPAVGIAAVALWPNTPIGRRLALRPPEPEEFAPMEEGPRIGHLVGQFGRALTPLRPTGSADFEGRRHDAQSEEGLIPAGTLVEAVAIRGRTLIVRTVRDDRMSPFGGDPTVAT